MHIQLDYIEPGLILDIEGDSADSTIEIPEEKALECAESQYQIKEGCTYDYQFNNKAFGLTPRPPQITVSKFNSYAGRLNPNIYVGSLRLDLICKDDPDATFDPVYIEVVPTKLNYSSENETDESYQGNYKSMLENIAARCSDLLMQINSPVSQKFEPDFAQENRTIYQRFAFVKSLIASDEFNDAVNRILYSPAARWREIQETTDIRKISRLTYSAARQIITGTNRIRFDLTENIRSVPGKILSACKTETYDIPENRFIKFALESFSGFCENCYRIFDENKYAKAGGEAKALIKVLNGYLEFPFLQGNLKACNIAAEQSAIAA